MSRNNSRRKNPRDRRTRSTQSRPSKARPPIRRKLDGQLVTVSPGLTGDVDTYQKGTLGTFKTQFQTFYQRFKVPVWLTSFLGVLQLFLLIVQSPSWLPGIISWPLLLGMLLCTVSIAGRKRVVNGASRTGHLIYYVALTTILLVVGVQTVSAAFGAMPRERQKQALGPAQDVVYTGQTLEKLNFTGKELINASFDETTLTQVSFRDSDLTESSFAGATLIDVDFEGANLCGSDFRGADLSNIGDFRGMANISFVIFDKSTKFPSETNPYLMPGMTEFKLRPILISCRPGVSNLVS